MFAGHAVALLTAAVATLAVADGAACQSRPHREVVVIAADPSDARIAATREAVAHWVTTYVELGLPNPFGKVKVITRQVPENLLARYSRSIVGSGTRPATPNELSAIPGDVIIVLSDAEIVSFAVPLGNGGKRLIGVRSDRTAPLSLPNVARNVLAHELGHALGLGHNRDPAMLMCGRPASCRPGVYRSDEIRFFPLTDSERRVLAGRAESR